MSLFKTLKVATQETSSREKINSVPLRPVNGSHTVSGHLETESVDSPPVDESPIVERIGKLNSLLKAREAMFVEETEHAERLINDLKSDLGVLQAKLKKTQEIIATKNLSHEEREKTLTAEIQQLQSEIKTKDETLALRDQEMTGLLKQLDTLELANGKMDETAREAKSAADRAENLEAKVRALESQLEQTEELARQKELTIEELAAKIKELESITNEKQKLLTARDAEISDLQSQLTDLTAGIAEMSSFLKQAARLSRMVDEQDAGRAVQNNRATFREIATTSAYAKVPSVLPEAAGETIPPEILQSIISELANLANVVVNVASVLVRQHAKDLGESIEKFPTKRLPELFESLATELADEQRQVDFRWRLAQAAQLYIY